MLPSALPFFLKADPGQRFCLYHQPDPARPARGAVLYVHPFAEELNRCRRMAALQSRALAAAGYGVLQIDLYGCGDSSGDFGDARLELWQEDLAVARQWLQARIDGPLLLWGVRLGALLALEFSTTVSPAPDTLLLWQPVSSGATHLKQFLRVSSAALMVGANAAAMAADADAPHEVAGYRIAPELSGAIAALEADTMQLSSPIHWFETAPANDDESGAPSLPPASTRLHAQWRSNGGTVIGHPYAGRPFWTSTEISVCPALLAATAALTSLSTARP